MADAPWQGNHLWLFPGTPLEQALQDAVTYGYDGVLIKTHDGNPADDSNHAYYGLLEQALRIRQEQNLDLTIGAWGYLYGPKYGHRQVDIEAQAVIDSIKQGPDWYVVDAEIEWEHPDAPEAAHRLVRTVREEYPDFPLGYTPIWNVRWHQRFPHAEFSQYCDVVLPQVYYVLAQRTTPERVRAMWRITREDFEPLGLPIAPVGQISRQSTAEQVRAFQEAIGDRPRSWWLWDNCPQEMLRLAGTDPNGQAATVPLELYQQAQAEIQTLQEQLEALDQRLKQIRVLTYPD